jgi:hypothetical protein
MKELLASPNEKRFHIRLLTNRDAMVYEHLIRRSFGNAKGFTVRSPSLVWTPSDDAYPVIGVFEGKRLLSTLRFEWILTPEELEVKSEEKKSPVKFDFPLGYLAKAATDPDFANTGLNSLLRYHAFKVIQHWHVSSILGFMVEGSPRVFTMQEMGYEFFQMSKKWDGNFQSDRPVLFGHLNVAKKFDFAMKYLETKLADLLPQVSVGFQHDQIPMKTRIPITFPWQRKNPA